MDMNYSDILTDSQPQGICDICYYYKLDCVVTRVVHNIWEDYNLDPLPVLLESTCSCLYTWWEWQLVYRQEDAAIPTRLKFHWDEEDE